jgi:hypothetical protein
MTTSTKGLVFTQQLKIHYQDIMFGLSKQHSPRAVKNRQICMSWHRKLSRLLGEG